MIKETNNRNEILNKAIHKLNSDAGIYRKVLADIESMRKLEISFDVKKGVYAELKKKCDHMREMLIHDIDMLPKAIMEENGNVIVNYEIEQSENKLVNNDNKTSLNEKNISSKNAKDDLNENKKSIEEEKSPFKLWKLKIGLKVGKIYYKDPSYVCSNEILKEIFEKMRNVYGIVWEQDFKEWRRDNCGVPNKLEIIFNNRKYKSIFDSILEDKLNTYSAENKDDATLQDIIKPLVVATNDNSIYGSATIRKIYSRMENYHDVNWDRYAKDYECVMGRKMKSRKELLYHTRQLMEKFRISTNELLCECK